MERTKNLNKNIQALEQASIHFMRIKEGRADKHENLMNWFSFFKHYLRLKIINVTFLST